MNLLISINPTFGDFALLALLLLLMHILTVIEVVRADPKDTGTASVDRAHAATWSFFGVFSTLAAGVASGPLRDTWVDAVTLGIPFLFMGRWAFHHWRITRLLEGSAIESGLDDLYSKAILKAFEGHSGGLTAEQVTTGAMRHLDEVRFIYASASLFKRYLPPSVIDRLSPDPDRMEKLLLQLQTAGSLSLDGNKYHRKVIHPSS
jgi:hypothetical protein